MPGVILMPAPLMEVTARLKAATVQWLIFGITSVTLSAILKSVIMIMEAAFTQAALNVSRQSSETASVI
jgi:hypothetical protein